MQEMSDARNHILQLKSDVDQRDAGGSTHLFYRPQDALAIEIINPLTPFLKNK